MRVLSIGNSFSEDAHHWLHQVAAAEGLEMTCVNLYIGGCSLKTHWENFQSEALLYRYELNGEPVLLDDPLSAIRYCSIQEALNEGGWDVITLQQQSGDSGRFETYEPYLSRLADAVRTAAPDSKLWIHQTWAYETDSTHADFGHYGCKQNIMYTCLRNAYHQAAEQIQAPVIRSGDVIQHLRQLPAFCYPHGGISLCRDGFHMNLTLGRYALAVTWFSTLSGKPPRTDYTPPGSRESELPLRALIRRTIGEMLMA